MVGPAGVTKRCLLTPQSYHRVVSQIAMSKRRYMGELYKYSVVGGYEMVNKRSIAGMQTQTGGAKRIEKITAHEKDERRRIGREGEGEVRRAGDGGNSET